MRVLSYSNHTIATRRLRGNLPVRQATFSRPTKTPAALLKRIWVPSDTSELGIDEARILEASLRNFTETHWRRFCQDSFGVISSIGSLQLRLRREVFERQWAMALVVCRILCLITRHGFPHLPRQSAFFEVFREHFELVVLLLNRKQDHGGEDRDEVHLLVEMLTAATANFSLPVEFPRTMVSNRNGKIVSLRPLDEPRDLLRIQRFSQAAAAITCFPFRNTQLGTEEFLRFMAKSFWIDGVTVFRYFMALAHEHARTDPDQVHSTHWTALNLQFYYQMLLYYAELIGQQHPLLSNQHLSSLNPFCLMSIEMLDQMHSRLFPRCSVARIFDAFLPTAEAVGLRFSQTQVRLINLMATSLNSPDLHLHEIGNIQNRYLLSLITDFLVHRLGVPLNLPPSAFRQPVLQDVENYDGFLLALNLLDAHGKRALAQAWWAEARSQHLVPTSQVQKVKSLFNTYFC